MSLWLFFIFFLCDSYADSSLSHLFRELYAEELAARRVKLTIALHADNPSTLAMAQHLKGQWKIDVYGGYLNGETSDGGLKLLICHEIGHLHERAIRYTKTYSIEGVADYFAGSDCAKKVFSDRSQFIKAAEELTRFWWANYYPLYQGPRPSRRIKSKERVTEYRGHFHHEPQCRLDIMTAGYDCDSEKKQCRPPCWLW